MNPDINGLWPALLLPVAPDGTLDTPRALAHARVMLAAGCDGVTLFGTTGEGPAFSLAERKGLLESLLGSGILASQILVTTTALALGEAIELGRHAARLGVHRQMFMPPFYFNQPREAGIIESVSQLVRGIGDDQLKLLLYHFPAMSTFGFSHEAIAELVRRHPGQVMGVKDSGGSLAHALELAKAFPALSILTGSEQHVAEVMRAGGSGSVNGLTNVAPRLMARVISNPHQVSPADSQLILSLLALLSVRPNMPFVAVYKLMLATKNGDAMWLNMRAPLSALDPSEAQAVRDGYAALGAQLETI
ncbi:MAG: dihydrodipicolinate synthase family protein [Rhodoferax sp.]|nr:dihydrodipicolinate synthase family protein [Rhodoferax sp.]